MNDNTEYLKKYVRDHPHNKMAWYLLGRDYEARGEERKALYCYRRSADVYAAFEQRANPAIREVLSKHETERGASGFFTSIRMISWRHVLMAIIFLLLIGIPLQSDGESPDALNVHEDDAVHTVQEPDHFVVNEEDEYLVRDQNAPPKLDQPEFADSNVQKTTQIYYLLLEQNELEHLPLLKEALIFPRTVEQSVRNIFVQAIPFDHAVAERSDRSRWFSWRAEPNYLFTVEHEPSKGISRVEYLDDNWCRCEIRPTSRVQAEFELWQHWQENEWLLLAALDTYVKRYGQNPENLNQLALDYPHNIISGYSAQMEEQFQQIRAHMEDEQHLLADQPTRSTSLPLADTRLSGQLFPGKQTVDNPLEIIVDRANHRLAIVHGNIIVRNYEVGLGGERTPLGRFEITEKVRNPNGRSDGEFGSRGMTLSDTLYAIHGTNDPASIGKDESLGCIRMHKEDVEELFDFIPLGTAVTIAENVLPEKLVVPDERFHLPVLSDETNDANVYRWLN